MLFTINTPTTGGRLLDLRETYLFDGLPIWRLLAGEGFARWVVFLPSQPKPSQVCSCRKSIPLHNFVNKPALLG